MFDLRFDEDRPLRVGQIVFDPNGEYANVNVQDSTCIKNVTRANPRGKSDDVVTYGILPHKNDPERKLMLLNFFHDDNLEIGKEMIDFSLADSNSIYVNTFRQVSLSPPEDDDRGVKTRHDRRVLSYRVLLSKAGFQVPTNLKPQTVGLFSKELIGAMKQGTSKR